MDQITQQTKHFEKCLSIGNDFEINIAYGILRETFFNFYVYNMQTDTNNPYGPAQRAHKGQTMGNIVMPDFMCANGKDMMWVDAKYKSYSMKVGDTIRAYTPFVALDHKKHQEYKKTMQQLPGELYLCYGVEGKVYITKWNDDPELYHFSSEKGKGNCPVYYIDNMKQIGTF